MARTRKSKKASTTAEPIETEQAAQQTETLESEAPLLENVPVEPEEEIATESNDGSTDTAVVAESSKPAGDVNGNQQPVVVDGATMIGSAMVGMGGGIDDDDTIYDDETHQKYEDIKRSELHLIDLQKNGG